MTITKTQQTYLTRLKKLGNIKEAISKHKQGSKVFYTYIGSKAKTEGLYRSYGAILRPKRAPKEKLLRELLEVEREAMLKKYPKIPKVRKKLFRGFIHKTKTVSGFKSKRFMRESFKPKTQIVNFPFTKEVKALFTKTLNTSSIQKYLDNPLKYTNTALIDVYYSIIDRKTGKQKSDNFYIGNTLQYAKINLVNYITMIIDEYETRMNALIRSYDYLIVQIRGYINIFEYL